MNDIIKNHDLKRGFTPLSGGGMELFMEKRSKNESRTIKNSRIIDGIAFGFSLAFLVAAF